MTTHSHAHHRFAHSWSAILGSLSARWSDYRALRRIESVPYAVMKDVGFPGADGNHGR